MKKEYKIAWIGFAGTILAVLITILFTVYYDKDNKSLKEEISISKFENPLQLNFHPTYYFDYHKSSRLKIKTNNEFNNYIFGIGISDKNGSLNDKISLADRRGLLDLSISLETDFSCSMISQNYQETSKFFIGTMIFSSYKVKKDFYILRRIYFDEVVLSVIIASKENYLENYKLEKSYELNDIEQLFSEETKDTLWTQSYDIKIEKTALEKTNQWNEKLVIKYPFENLILDGVIESGNSNNKFSKKQFKFLYENRSYDNDSWVLPVIYYSNNYFYGHLHNKIDILERLSQGVLSHIQSETSVIDSLTKSKSISASYNKLRNIELVYFEIKDKVLLEKYCVKSDNIEILNE